MTFTENRTYGVPEFAGTEVNRHSGKLKGLSGGHGCNVTCHMDPTPTVAGEASCVFHENQPD